MGCWVCGKRRLLPWACRPCRRERRRMRRDYLARFTDPLDARPYPAGMTQQEHPQPRRMRRRWFLVAGGVVILAVGGAAYALQPGAEDKATERCHTAVRAKLFSPSTAVFADEVQQNNTPPVYRVLGEVDAQNKVGATLRGEYICVLRLEDDGSWVTVDAMVMTR